jgi:hypothetical protein
MIDFVTATLVGSSLQSIVRPALRRLNTKIKGCAHQYNTTLKKNILRHCLLDQIAAASSDEPKEAVSKTLNQLNKEGGAYMKHAEQKCRRLKSGCIPFSPEVLLWIGQCQVYWSLLRWHASKIRN